jgi:hypothetical protein
MHLANSGICFGVHVHVSMHAFLEQRPAVYAPWVSMPCSARHDAYGVRLWQAVRPDGVGATVVDCSTQLRVRVVAPAFGEIALLPAIAVLFTHGTRESMCHQTHTTSCSTEASYAAGSHVRTKLWVSSQ